MSCPPGGRAFLMTPPKCTRLIRQPGGTLPNTLALAPCGVPGSPMNSRRHPLLAEPAAPLDITRLLTTSTDNLVGMIYRCRIDAIWTMEYVSEGCHKLTGYRPDELVFNTRVSYDQITLPEDRARVSHAIHAALDRNEAFDVEYRIERADGRTGWVLERGVGIRDESGRV